MNRFYPVVVVPLGKEEGGGYLGYAPDLKGCMSHGDTPEDAFTSTRDAILEWIDEAKAQGHDIPEPGSAAIHAKQEYERLLIKIKDQSKVIETMDKDIQQFQNELVSLKSVLATLTERLGDMQLCAAGTPAGYVLRAATKTEEAIH